VEREPLRRPPPTMVSQLRQHDGERETPSLPEP